MPRNPAGGPPRSAGNSARREVRPSSNVPRRDSFPAVNAASPIKVHVPGVLRPYCDGAKELQLAAANVRAALDEIERRHPALYRNICDETGAVRRHVNVFVNTSNVRDREGLDSALAPGDLVTILPAVSGG